MRTSLLVLAAVSAAATTAAALPGWWAPIADVNSTHVKEVGAWAVAEHVEHNNDGLRFRRVVSGEQQHVASGMNYWLAIVAAGIVGKEAN